MKRLLIALLVMLMALPDFGQQGNVVLIQFAGVPSGTCSNIMVAVNKSNGDFYNCNPSTSTWSKVNGASVTPAGSTANLQYNNGGVLGAVPDGGVGQVLLGQGSGNPPIFTDPTIQGTQADGSAVKPSPVGSGGWDYTNGLMRLFGYDPVTHGLIVNVPNTLTLGNLPQQPLLNTADFNDVVASSPVRGGMIVANSTPKWAQVAAGVSGNLWEMGASDPSWTNALTGNYTFTGNIGQFMNFRVMDGTKYALTDVGLQQAINDACPANVGGMVYIPANTTVTLAATITFASNQIFCTIEGEDRSSNISINHTSDAFVIPNQDLTFRKLQFTVTTASSRAAVALFNVTNINFYADKLTFRGNASSANNGDIFKYTDGASEVRTNNVTLEGGFKWNRYIAAKGTGVTVSGIYDTGTIIYGGAGTTQCIVACYDIDTLVDNWTSTNVQMATGGSKDVWIRNTGAGSPAEWVHFVNVRLECANSTPAAVTIDDVLDFEFTGASYITTCHNAFDLNGGKEFFISSSIFNSLQTGIATIAAATQNVQFGPNILAKDVCNAADNTYDGLTFTAGASGFGVLGTTWNNTISNRCKRAVVTSGTSAKFTISENDFSRGSFQTRAVDNTATGADISIRDNRGGVNDVAQTVSITGSINTVALATPAAPTVAPTCSGTCASTWGYKIIALDKNGGVTAASTETTTALNAATLDSTHFNTITWTAVGGANTYKVFRSTKATTPATLGVIATINSDAPLSFVDNAVAGDASTAPATNTTGSVSIPANSSTVGNAVLNNAANTATSAMTLDMSLASPTAGFREPVAAGAAPLTSGVKAFDSTALQFVGGVNGVKQPFAMQGVVKGGILNLMVTGSNFVTAANTNLQTITGLSFTFPASLAMNATLDCDLTYSQQTAAVADAFGFQDATVAPTNLEATGFVQTAATTWVDSTLTASSTTTATNIVAMTPSAITTIWHAKLHIGVEQPSNASTSLFSVMVKTGTSADTVTVFRGSGCLVNFQ